jgi:membrane protease YdiL (CAAX protease family)
MRSLCCPLFSVLSIFFFALYLTQTHVPNPDMELLAAAALTFLISAVFYWLYKLIRRLRPNPILWRIIYSLIGLIILLVIFSVPEIRQIVSGWIEGISAQGEKPIVFSVLCLIIAAVCCTRPTRTAS